MIKKTLYGKCSICGNRKNAMKNDSICIICYLNRTSTITYEQCISEDISESQTEIDFIKKFGLKCDNRKIKQIGKTKMKRERNIIKSKDYISPDNIDEGSKGDFLVVKIISDGELEPSNFSDKERLIIKVEGNFSTTDEDGHRTVNEGEEKKLNLSPTNENVIQDMYGIETMDWIGKKIKLLIESCNVGKSGKMITVCDKKIE